MKILDPYIVNEVKDVYQNWYFAIEGESGLFRYVTHSPVTTRKYPPSPFTAIYQVDDGITTLLLRIESFYPLKHENVEEQIAKIFKVAVIS